MSHNCPSCNSDLFPIMDYEYKVEFYCPKCNKKVIGIRKELYDKVQGTELFKDFHENSQKKYL